ncbi:hypothetical protein R3P38DRAFT_3179371 [Favolaschia claudopus]|uniref:Uncharacterized protein n=1 Tax=Favolaschia claudopus TaxID=2862362 RepID=A0AAW0CVN1_9AGAR
MALSWVFWEEIAVLGSGNIRPPTPVLHLLSSITTPAYLALPSPYRSPYSPVSLPAFLDTLPPSTAHTPTAVGSPCPVQPSAYKRLDAVQSPLIIVYPYALRLSRPLLASSSRSTSPDPPRPQFRLCNPSRPIQRYNSLTTTFQHPEHSPSVVSTASARTRVAPLLPTVVAVHRRRCPPPHTLPLPYGLSTVVACVPTSQRRFRTAAVSSAHSVSFSALQTCKPATPPSYVLPLTLSVFCRRRALPGLSLSTSPALSGLATPLPARLTI